MVIFLALTPIVAIMAWTFLKVGTVTRVQALEEERRIRATFAAEGVLRYALLSGQSKSEIELNGCKANVTVQTASLEATAEPDEAPTQGAHIQLSLDKGFVSKRSTDEKD